MILYLLPSEKKKSKMDLVKEDYFSIIGEKEKNRYQFLNDLRKELIQEFHVKTYPLLPAWRRYKGKFWESMEFWCLPSKVQQRIIDRGIIVSPLFGLLAVNDLIPEYYVSFSDKYKGVSLKKLWKEELKDYLNETLKNSVIFDFLTTEQREVVNFPEGSKVVRFEYVRKGKRVVNPMPHRAYTLRYIAEKDVNLQNLEKINFYDYKVKEIREDKNLITVVMEGEGKYI